MKNRYELYDGLGVYGKYKTRERAEQAIKDIGAPVGQPYWKLVDKVDGSTSYIAPDFGMPDQE